MAASSRLNFSLRKEPITARSSHRPSQNWRDDCNPPVQRPATSAASHDQNKAPERRIAARETVKPLQRTANRFIPPNQRQTKKELNQKDFSRTLRSQLNKVTGENCHIICNKLKNILTSCDQQATDDHIATLAKMLLQKVIFDKGLGIEAYVQLCEAVVLGNGKLDVFTAALLDSAREVVPGLQQTKEIVAVASFATELFLNNIITESPLTEIMNLMKDEDHLKVVAICHIVKSRAQALSAICPSLYDSWAYSVAWQLMKPLPKRVLFMCEDAVKIARESRRKAFVVILMAEEPDTVEMWFSR